MTLRLGEDLAPRSAGEREGLLAVAGVLDRADCPLGFMGHSAIWARDRDLLVGQAALVELSPDALDLRAKLIPGHMDSGTRVALIDMLAVRPEYRETGLEERLTRFLIDGFAKAVPRPPEALIYVGESRAPVLLSTLRTLGLTDAAFR